MSAKLAAFAGKIKTMRADKRRLKVVSVSEVRVEGMYRAEYAQTLAGKLVQLEWWATEQNGKVHLCTEYHDASVVVNSAQQVYDCLDSVVGACKQEANKAFVKEAEQAIDVVDEPESKARKTLLVWNEIPDKVRLFVVPQDHPMYAAVKASNNLYINSDELAVDHAIYSVNDWVDKGGVMFEKKPGFKARISEVISCGVIG